ncbi:MAG TPA: 50S ribosomal protein L11 methyltransferase, partial [Candidatus Pullichristensenella stercoripullorum]|nr:50S ribosomal protein L11 methyltransferase [Candidatus Pullichristensenella stercoripullorum]
MQWTEVTVLTTTQGSEMVSAILEQAGSKGVMIEDKNDVYANQRPEGQWDIIDEAIAERIGDDVRVTGYYPVDEHLESAMAAIREGLSGLRAQNLPFDLGKLEVLTNTVDEEDWAESWKKDFTPIRLGKHMVVKPSWCEYEAQAGDHIIELDPGMAFGTGTHETTGMCVRLVEEHV